MKKISCASCGKRYDCDADGFCPRCGPSISLQGTETRRSSRRNRNFSRGRSPQHAGEREPHSAAKEGGLLLGLEVVSDLAVDLVGDAISDLFS